MLIGSPPSAFARIAGRASSRLGVRVLPLAMPGSATCFAFKHGARNRRPRVSRHALISSEIDDFRHPAIDNAFRVINGVRRHHPLPPDHVWVLYRKDPLCFTLKLPSLSFFSLASSAPTNARDILSICRRCLFWLMLNAMGFRSGINNALQFDTIERAGSTGCQTAGSNSLPSGVIAAGSCYPWAFYRRLPVPSTWLRSSRATLNRLGEFG